MPNLIMTKLKGQDHEKTLKVKIFNFLQKLTDDDTSVGLHVEKMNNPVDDRARTARVDGASRAVLYLLEPVGGEKTYVYAGTWEHDTAIARARTQKLAINPVNGIAELIDAGPTAAAPAAAPAETVAAPVAAPQGSFLTGLSYFVTDLTDEFGFTQDLADRAFAAASEDALMALVERLETPWQADVLVGMGAGLAISQIKEQLGIGTAPAEVEAPLVVEPEIEVVEAADDEDTRLVRALQHPAAKMQFTFVDGEDELQRIIEGGDFGAWRVFLHPQQRNYATRSYKGAFRLTGGAGTGKTVVLLHRARNLAKENPNARIILSTFTRALADNLRRDLERLDPTVPIAKGLGEIGVYVAGLDQIAAAVRSMAGAEFADASGQVLGVPVASGTPVGNDKGWDDALDDSMPDLPAEVRLPSFFEAEYLQVVLPNAISSKDEYFQIRRPGRGIALDRKKRAEVWRVIEQYRKNARTTGNLTFAEIASISAEWLNGAGAAGTTRVADHVLIDEGQDLTPSHWHLMRALVAPGANDLFIADDIHQRIYGSRVVLSRFDINIVGRSRRLTLNYRTTEENLKYALGVLGGVTYLDSDNEEEGVAGYRSARRGPKPHLVAADSLADIQSLVLTLVNEWIADGVSPETIAILADTRAKAKAIADALTTSDRPVTVLEKASDTTKGTPVALTMYTSKGLEFSRVVLYDISKESYPTPYLVRMQGPDELEDFLLKERSLLYVAASRARDELVVTWRGAPSDLLA